MLRQIKPEVECYLNMSFLHTPLDRDTWNHFLFQNKFLHFDRYPFGKDFSLLRKSWDEQQLTKMVIFSEKGRGSLSRGLPLFSFTVKPVYNGPVYSGHTVYYCHQTTSQNFQLPYISFKVELYISVTLYITVTLPFPKGDRCTQVWSAVPAWPIQAFRFLWWCIKMWAEKTASGLRVKVSSCLLLPLFLSSPSLLFSWSLTSRCTPLFQGWI